MATILTVDGTPFELHDGAWSWNRSSPVPTAWRALLDALAYGMYEPDDDGGLRLATTRAKVIAGRVTRALTGTLDGEPVVCVWPLADEAADG
jgi:hypothetical protein